MEEKKQVVYELLGSPSLLYRHAPSYTLLHECNRKEPSRLDLPRWRTEFVRHHRIKARFFDTSARLSGKKPRVAEEEYEDYQDKQDAPTEPDEGHNAIVLAEIRRKMFPNNPAMPTALKQLDRTFSTGEKKSFGTLTKEIIMTSRQIALERTNAAPEYLAPFYSENLKWGLGDEKETSTVQPEFYLEPRQHGNCLVSFRCPCCQSTRCVIHPTGEMLSKICVSTVKLPQEKGAEPPKRKKFVRTHELEIGERILQLEECSPWETGTGYFVIRTSSFSTLVSIETNGNCSFDIKLVNRMDLRSLSRNRPSFRPRDVTAHPKYGNSFTDPLVAAISMPACASMANVIHCGIDSPIRHNIDNLQNIDLVEFSTSHPRVLHASATSHVRPALIPNFVSKRPMLGHGSSLYTVDLRSNQATFQWSPSAEEFVTESVHSVSGIVSDWNKEHSLFVASTSAGKCWEIDSRMPYKALNSWSLPGLCHSMGTNAHRGDLHGGGTLLHQPRNVYKDGVLRPFLSVDKSHGDFGLCIYQQPLMRPLLETTSLELSGGPGLDGVSVARSSVFPLPDVSNHVFTCGVASFRDTVSSILTSRQCSELGYANDPSMALCVVTMTQNGDLYSSILLECNDLETTKAVLLNGFGGARRLSAATFVDDNGSRRKPWVEKGEGGFELRTFLGDVPATPSSQLKRTCVESRSDCAQFTAIPYHEMRQGGACKEKAGENNQTPPTATWQNCASSAETGGNASLQLDKAVQDLQMDDYEITTARRRVRDSGQQDVVALAGRLWTQPTPNVELSNDFGADYV